MKNQCICLKQQRLKAQLIWQGYRQCRDPILPEVQHFIQGIDQARDARLLRSCSIESEAILTNRIGTTLLKRGAAAGLSLSEIAALCLRSHNNQSMLERHVRAARCRAKASKRHSIGNNLACSNVECTFGEKDGNCACVCRPPPY